TTHMKKDLDVSKPTFSTPHLDAFCQLEHYGVTVTGQHINHDQAALECRVVEADSFCRQCGGQARVRGSLVRRVTHVPLGWRPTQLHLRLRRYRCDDCACVWQQDTTSVVAPEAKLSHAAALWALKSVVIDLTPVADGIGPARLLDMVPGRSKQTFINWLSAQTSAFRKGVEIVAMDGFTGYKTAATEQLPEATTVMDPFHVVALAGTALDKCRQRIQQATLGRRGKTGAPLYGIRKTLRTGNDYL